MFPTSITAASCLKDPLRQSDGLVRGQHLVLHLAEGLHVVVGRVDGGRVEGDEVALAVGQGTGAGCHAVLGGFALSWLLLLLVVIDENTGGKPGVLRIPLVATGIFGNR